MLLLSPRTVMIRVRNKIRKIDAIRLEIKEIQARCAHDWQYEIDPSGNNDSGYYCRSCNSIRKHLE